jgi:nitrite reductase/ring-hydroxylating ferredoxin subunit
MARVELCSVDDVAEGNVIKIETSDLILAVYKVEGQIFVTDEVCTHGPGSLSEGYLEDHIIECNFHGGQFDIRDGSIVSPPCVDKLKVYATSVENNKVFIEVE